MLRRDPPTLLLTNKRAIGNAHQGVMGAIEAALFKIDVIGRNQWHFVRIGIGHQMRLRRRLSGGIVPLKLDIQTVAKGGVHGPKRCLRLSPATRRKQGIHRAIGAARQ